MANEVDTQTMLAALARMNNLEERVRELELTERLSPDASWAAATLQNSWQNYNAVYGGSQFHDAAYYRDAGRFVHIRGLIADGTLTSSTVIFNLPSSLRPTRQVGAVVISSNAFGRIDITTGGDVIVVNVPSNGFVFLDGIRFHLA